jgi:hypothetical protein
MTKTARLLRLLVPMLVLPALPPGAAWAGEPPQWSAGGSTGFGYDSNPANAESGNTVPATGFAEARVAETLALRPADHLAVLLRGSLDGQQYFDYVGLSNGKASLLLRGIYRPDGGFYAPTFALWGSAAAWQFGSRMRSGADYRGGAYVSEQLSTAVDLRLGGYADERRSTSRAFDLDGQAATLDADWLLDPRCTAYLGFEYRRGRFATTSPPDPGAAAEAHVIENDDAIRRQGLPERVYRLQGHARIGTLGLNYALTPALALDAQAQEIHTRADFGDHYDRWLGSLSLLAKF